MLIKERSYSSPAYRYGFNGKEKNDEINVDGGDYDFGARIYDTRLGRWLSLDPLIAKYPSLCPYNFCGNNPILFLDFDGNDYGIIIDHEKKTITIVANYYVIAGKTEDKAAANAGIKPYMDSNGKFYFENGDQTANYTLKFDLKVIESEDPIKSASTDPFGNSVIINESKVDELGKKSEGKNHEMAVTEHGKNIYLRENSSLRQREHEVGHTLGLGHFNFGFMLFSENLDAAPDVRKEYITQMLQYPTTTSCDNISNMQQTVFELPDNERIFSNTTVKEDHVDKKSESFELGEVKKVEIK